MTLWFVGIRNETRTTIQSIVAETFQQAVTEVLNKPILDNVTAYLNLVNNEFVWVNLNEQN